MARRKIFQGAYYIQDTHWGTHFIYIQNIHLEHTLELHPFYIRALARIYVHYNSIQKLHFQHTLDFHQACPVHLLVHPPVRSFTYCTTQNHTHFIYIQKLHFNSHQNYIHSTSAPLLAPTLIGVLSHYNYIQNIHQNYIHFSLDYLLRVCLFIYIIITFRNYISTYTKLTLNCPSIYLPTPLHHLLRAHHTQHYTINVCPLVCFPVRCARQAYIINIFIIYLSNCVHPPMNLTRDCARSRFTPLEGALFSKKGSAGAFYYYIYSIFRNVITK